MALCSLFGIIAVKALLVNGFGFNVAPFQMEVQLPAGGPGPFGGSPFGGASPLSLPMSLMSFPPIFNPLEAMGMGGGRGEMGGDARGDVNGPMGNVTTKNSTESKDGFKVTTITSDGPGFHSYIKEYEKEGNDTTNSTRPAGPPPDIGKMLSSGKIFDIMNQLRNMGKKPPKCKKCGKGKFCDPIFHLCRKKFAEGRTCMAQKQCGANLRCQWGKCQKAKKGDPGTFCKGNGQCNGDSCCRNTPGSFHLMCIPPQAEGSICGLHQRQESVAKLFYVVKRSTVATCSPCKSGLKCANTGGSRFKRCAKDSFVEKAAEEMEDENPSNAITEDKKEEEKEEDSKEEDKKEEGSGSGDDDDAPKPLEDPNVPDRHDTGDDPNNKGEEELEKEKKKKKEEKEEEKEEKEDDDDEEEEEAEDKDEDKKKEKEDDEEEEEEKKEEGKEVSKEDDKEDEEDDKEDEKDEKDDKKKKPIDNGDGMDIQVAPKKKKKAGKTGKKAGKKGKGKKTGKKD